MCKGGSISEKKNIRPTPITQMSRWIEQWFTESHCRTCHEPLVITEFECILREGVDEYGNSTDYSFSGHWICNLEHIGPIYPIPLRRVAMNEGITNYVGFQKYATIIKEGYPWKCPVCKEQLLFISDSVYRC